MLKEKKNIRILNNTQQLRPYRFLKPNLDKNCNFVKWAKFLLKQLITEWHFTLFQQQ